MNIDTLAREAARRAQGEIAMVDVPESNAVLSTRRSQHRTRNAIAGVAAVLLLAGGAAGAFAATRGDDKKPNEVAVKPVDEQLPAGALDALKQMYWQGSQYATSADWVRRENTL